MTALATASMHGHTDCVDELLEAGAKPDIATHTGHRSVERERERERVSE